MCLSLPENKRRRRRRKEKQHHRVLLKCKKRDHKNKNQEKFALSLEADMISLSCQGRRLEYPGAVK